MAISSKDAEDIRRMLECPICLERQDTPRLLPCIHTFCQGCIQTFIDKRGKNGQLSCPGCSRVMPQLSSKSPVHLVTPNPDVKEHSVCVSRFQSQCEGMEKSTCCERAGCVSSVNCRCTKHGESGCRGLSVCDGGIVVTDSKNTSVKVFDKLDFKLKLKLQQDRHKLQQPGDVTCSDSGEIFVTDWGIHGVVRYDARGRLMKVYPGVYRGAGYITCHNDQLVVSDPDGGRVIITDFCFNIHHKLDAQTLGLDEFRPLYVCMDNSGHVVVCQCDPGRVHVIDYKRPAVVSTLTDQLGNRPRDVCVDPHGHILVAVGCSNQLILYNNTRAHVLIPRGEVKGPTGLCLPAPGQVSVVEYWTGVVKTFQYLEK